MVMISIPLLTKVSCISLQQHCNITATTLQLNEDLLAVLAGQSEYDDDEDNDVDPAVDESELYVTATPLQHCVTAST